MKRQNVCFFVLICAVIVACAAAAAVASRIGAAPAKSTAPARTSKEQAAQTTAARAHTPYPFLVTPSRLRPEVRAPFGVLGGRLARPGNERLTLTGTLQRAGSSRAERVRVTHEFPNLLLAEGEAGTLASFDEREALFGPGRAVGPEEELIVETLLYDSAEHFFFAQVRGAATRSLGSRARPDGASYAGPVYDVYEVTEEVAGGGTPPSRTKRYFFNSDTQLLEVVRYEVEHEGARVSVEVRVGGWRIVRGQQIPTSFERLEAGRTVFTFTAESAALGPRGRGAQVARPRLPA